MSYFTQFSSASPAKVTTYTSGSGNFTPISTNQSWARITLVAGGGGGRGAGGGGGGTRIVEWVKLTLSSYPYAVGAGGNGGSNVANGNAGGNTVFGSFAVSGGNAGGVNDLNNNTAGGLGGGTVGFAFLESNVGTITYDYRLSGGRGGNGYNNDTGTPPSRGRVVGMPLAQTSNNYTYASAANADAFQNNVAVNNFGGGGGGDSYMGLGGAGGANVNNNNGSAGNGYGAGGGGGLGNTAGAGTGGIIIVEEFVQ